MRKLHRVLPFRWNASRLQPFLMNKQRSVVAGNLRPKSGKPTMAVRSRNSLSRVPTALGCLTILIGCSKKQGSRFVIGMPSEPAVKAAEIW